MRHSPRKTPSELITEMNILLKQKRACFFGKQLDQSTVHAALSDYSDTIDHVLEKIAQNLRDKTSNLPCIIAIGGYGRSELAPFSDVDLLLLYDAPLSPAVKKFAETLQTACWEIGLKPACSIRTVAQCVEALTSDIHFLTSLLDRRLVLGNKTLFAKLEKACRHHAESTPASTFAAAKLAERDARHKKTGDTRYLLQPNVKEGKGALRDIQTLLWLSDFIYDAKTPKALEAKKLLTLLEADTLRKASAFFWTVRCHLHTLADRAEDRLSFEAQPEIARRMSYKDAEPHLRAESFMKDYFLMTNEVGHLTRILCAALEAESLKSVRKTVLLDDVEGFRIDHSRLTAKDPANFEKNSSEIIRLFRVSQRSGLDIHPDALRHIRALLPALNGKLSADKEAQRIFLDILLDKRRAEQTLRHMNEAGLLSALIPPFGNIVAHMQYDMYHAFTADEHTLRAVGLMHKIENGTLSADAPLATELFTKIKSRRALYAAMFLHDVAKGTGGKHDSEGANIAKLIAPKIGLSPEETETTIWLVENHLLMTHTAYKRDLHDAKSIDHFVSIVQSPERLKLLTILTTADIMAVGPDKWNNWKSGLLSDLYCKSADAMSGTSVSNLAHDLFIEIQKKTRRLIGKKISTFNYLIDQAPVSFWMNFTPDAIAGFIETLHEKEKTTVIKITPNPQKDFTEVFIYTPDRKGLFATLSGAMAACGASIGEARIYTLGSGMALDVFYIQNAAGHVYDNIVYLQRTLKASLNGTLNLASEIAARQKMRTRKMPPFKIETRVIIDNNAGTDSTMIEINSRDRPGLLFDIALALTQENLQISAAKITTFGSRAVDVFYVKDVFGLKILHNEKLAMIEHNLAFAIRKDRAA
jgi:[protein-PII] uridylyltransferase